MTTQKQIYVGAGYRVWTADCPYCGRRNLVWDGTGDEQKTDTCRHYRGVFQSDKPFVPVMHFQGVFVESDEF